MLKTQQYSANHFDSIEQVYVSNRSEMKCRVLKQHIQSYLTQGLSVSAIQFKAFLVPSPGGWDVHPINSSDQENIYQVIADGERGPMIITLKHIVCTKFHIEAKYPETIVVLTNFVVHMSEKMYSERHRDDLPLSLVRGPNYSKQVVNAGMTQRVAQTGHKHIPYNTAKHSGFAFSKRAGPVLVMNNATTAHTVKLGSSQDSESSVDTSVSFVQKKPSAFQPKKHTRTNSYPQVRSIPMPLPLDSMPQNKAIAWTKSDIREFLHPGYPVEGIPKTAIGSTRKVTVKYVAYPIVTARPSISRSSSTPQMTQTDLKTDRYEPRSSQRHKEKWVSGCDFKRVFSSSRVRFATPQEAEPPTYPLLHRFREETKSAWVAGSFKR